MTSGNKYLEKVASFGVFAKNTAEDIFSRTPAGQLGDMTRLVQQSLHKRGPSNVRAAVDKIHAAGGLEKAPVELLEDLIKHRKMTYPVVDATSVNQAAIKYHAARDSSKDIPGYSRGSSVKSFPTLSGKL